MSFTKTYYVYGVVVSLCFGVVGITMAQTTTDATSSSSANDISTTTPVVTTPSATPVTSAMLSVIAQRRITNLTANISNRLEAYIRRIENITNRLESRQQKIATEGKDVRGAITHIAAARTALTTARSTLATIDADVAAFVGSPSPKDRFEVIKTTYRTAYDAIKTAHRESVAALLILRDAPLVSTDLENTSTTTEEISN